MTGTGLPGRLRRDWAGPDPCVQYPDRVEEYVLPHAAPVQSQPFIQGTRIVWTETNTTGSTDLFWADLPPGAAYRVPAPDSWKGNPVIYGDKIAWKDDVSGTARILMYDINNSRVHNLAPNVPAGTFFENPAIRGDLVAWQDSRNSVDWDIWMNDTRPSRWEQKQLVLSPAEQSADQMRPCIAGDLIAYEDSRYGWSDIYLYNMTSGTELGNLSPVDDNYSQESPQISGDRVIWLDAVGARPGTRLIRMYNATTKKAYSPDFTDRARIDQPARISGNRLVWTDDGPGPLQIRLYTLGPARTCPVADFTASPMSGAPGLVVNFTDTTSAPQNSPVTHYLWNFADGKSSPLRNTSHTFPAVGQYPVSLTVGNSWCRNATPVADQVQYHHRAPDRQIYGNAGYRPDPPGCSCERYLGRGSGCMELVIR